MSVDPNSLSLSHKTIHNQCARKHHKNYQAKVKAYTLASYTTSSSQPLYSFDQPMLEPLEEANHTNNMQMDKHDDFICILDSVVMSLDMKDTLDDNIIDSNDNKHVSDDEYLNIYIDYYFPNILSKQLTITPNIEHRDSHQSPCLDMIVVPTMLDFIPLGSFPSFPNDIDYDEEGGQGGGRGG